MAVPAAALPRARAILTSRESAPKDMWLTYTGVSMTSGIAASGPMTVRVFTLSVSLSGRQASWAPLIRISSHPITFLVVRMGSRTEAPVIAISWIMAISASSGSEVRRQSAR